uniref:Pectinesterase n=1 Tax=Cunninghamia lanceolata TaxID=28977 RepID=A0A6G9W468_CUNLA|nr:pectin methylesterase 15 [Cunninghamia lanceolata]
METVELQSQPTAHKGTRIAIFGVIMGVAIFCVIMFLVVFQFSPMAADGKEVIYSLCNITLHPNLCVSALSSYHGVQRANSKNLAHFVLKVSLQSVREGYSTTLKVAPQKMESNDSMAVEDCRQLLQQSMEHIDRSLREIGGMHIKPLNVQIADVKTWLSAALTNHETCLDGFRESTGEVRDDWEENSQNWSLISNALALIQIFSPDWYGIPRPLLDKQGFPRWMSVGDRRLLQVPHVAALQVDATVAQDGTGQYNTITEAVMNAPSFSSQRYVIYVKAGVYQENVLLSKNKTNLMLIGDGRGHTIVASRRNVKDGSTTFSSATFAASGEGFIARDMTFANIAGPDKHQAVALRVGGDLSAIYRCNFIGFQSTLYVHSLAILQRCNIYGTVDFIFGNAAAVFQDCNIVARKPMENQNNTITAQGRIDPNQNTGISIQNCRIVASTDLDPVKSSFRTYLGRPWKVYSRTVVIQSFLGDVVDPAGWLEWSYGLENLYYGEYMNTGPGAKVEGRVRWPSYK